MHTPIDFLEAKKNKEIKKLYKKTGYSKELEKQGTFVARFSYPIEIGDIINFVERMGIIHEDKILPELYKIQKIVAVKED
tara:strand:- start:635 stop:874 length:240 start_codon:yes stop_codon:yes gene_type:complete